MTRVIQPFLILLSVPLVNSELHKSILIRLKNKLHLLKVYSISHQIRTEQTIILTAYLHKRIQNIATSVMEWLISKSAKKYNWHVM